MAGPIMGLDISLVGTGVVVIPPDWRLGDWDRVFHRTVGYSIARSTEEELQERIDTIAVAVAGIARELRVETCFREDYAWGMVHGAQRLGEVTGCVKLSLFRGCGLLTRPVSPTAWRKLLIGMGKAPPGLPKGWIKLEAHCRLREQGQLPDGWNGDEMDALSVANYGLSELGLPAMRFLTPEQIEHERRDTIRKARRRSRSRTQSKR